MARALTVVVGGGDSALAAVAGEIAEPALTAADLREAVALAADGWLWLVDGAARPEPGALEVLLAAAQEPAALLAGLPVDAAGRPCEAALPAGAFAAPDALVASVGRGLVPIRNAPADSLLVDGAAARAADPPDPRRYGPLAARAWTAQLLARTTGYLVPGSRVRVEPPRPAPPLAGVRMARDGLWTWGDAVRAVSPRRRG